MWCVAPRGNVPDAGCMLMNESRASWKSKEEPELDDVALTHNTQHIYENTETHTAMLQHIVMTHHIASHRMRSHPVSASLTRGYLDTLRW